MDLFDPSPLLSSLVSLNRTYSSRDRQDDTASEFRYGAQPGAKRGRGAFSNLITPGRLLRGA
jgi:hypothetical protein